MKNLRVNNAMRFFLCLLLCTSLLFGSAAFLFPAGAAAFAGGKGTKSDPYLIKTAEQLQAMNQYTGEAHKNRYFKLSQNIDVGGYSSGKGWIPIGIYSAFYGTLDGNGKVVENLIFNRPTDNAAGLFAATSGATIKNLRVQIPSTKHLIGGMAVGGVVGRATNNTTLSNCSVSGGTVQANDSSLSSTPTAGGLVGLMEGSGSITNCSVSSKVISYASRGPEGLSKIAYSGGLAGMLLAQDGNITVTGCYSAFGIYSSCAAGGLVGYAGENVLIQKSYASGSVGNFLGASDHTFSGGGLVGILAGTVKNCYATGRVSVPSDIPGEVGGLVGYLYGQVSNSYSSGRVEPPEFAAKPATGGFVGDYYGTSLISRSYYDWNTSWQGHSAGNDRNVPGVTAKTTAEMKKQSTFSGWNFDSIWSIREGKEAPRFTVSSLSLDKSSLALKARTSATLTAKISPASAPNQTAVWSSSNTSVATVSTKGKVNALKDGTAVITLTADGKTASCKVTVTSTYVTVRIGYTRAIQNDKKTTIDNQGTKPVLVNGRAMIPLRFVSEKMGGKVKYVNDSQPIVLTYGDKKIEFTLGSYTMTVITGTSKQNIPLDVPARIVNGRTMIPLRAIAESLGFDVYYASNSAVIVVSSCSMTTAVREARVKDGKAYIIK